MRAAPIRQRFLVIHNPEAGVKNRALLYKVLERLEAAGARVTTQIADTISNDTRLAAEVARSGAYDVVVAAGGDSTIRGVAAGLAGTATPLGIIPIGTGNVMANEIGLKRKARAVAGCLLRGTPVPVTEAEANGEPFFLMAGAGFDGAVVARLNSRLKRMVGRFAYTWPFLRTLFADRMPNLRVTMDGKTETASWVVVTKARHYGGPFVIDREASLAAPEFKAVLFKARSRWELLRQLASLAAGKIDHLYRVERRSCRRVEISSERPVKVQIDGEPLGETPLILETGRRAFRLLVPDADQVLASRPAKAA